jgi:hypothetical protein
MMTPTLAFALAAIGRFGLSLLAQSGSPDKLNPSGGWIAPTVAGVLAACVLGLTILSSKRGHQD